MTLKERYLALPHITHLIIYVCGGVLLLLLFVYGGGYLRDKWNQKKYEETLAADSKKATDAEQKEQQALGVAQQAIAERDAALKQANDAHQQLVEAVGILNDATKSTQQKRDAYNKIINQPVPVISTPGQSVEDFCTRAKSLGLSSTAWSRRRQTQVC